MVKFVRVAGLALTMVLFAGCGGGDDQAKVEASLQHYLDRLPQPNAFPIGAGVPQVTDNGCTDRNVKTEKGQSLSSRNVSFFMGERVALWSCIVSFGTLEQPVLVGVGDSTKVVWATPGEFKQFKLKYERHSLRR